MAAYSMCSASLLSAGRQRTARQQQCRQGRPRSSSQAPKFGGVGNLISPLRTHSARRTVKAMAGDFNPFKNKKSEDAAKKALQDMFGDKEDQLASNDPPPGGMGGGKGGSGGGGGGGGNWFGDFNFDPQGWGRSFMYNLKRLMTTLGAVALFGLIMYVLSYWQQVAGLIGMVITKVFRLDAGQRKIAGAGNSNLQASLDDDKSEFGVMEESVIAKYGGDDDGPAADEVGEDEEEDF